MRPKDARVSLAYLEFLLRDPSFQVQIEAMGAGSVMRHFGPAHLRQMTVRVPPLADQRRIAGVLGTLDDKIEHSRAVARRLNEMNRLAYIRLARESGEGWSVNPIGRCVSVLGGSTPSTREPRYWDGDIPFATPKDLAGLEVPALSTTERAITEEGVRQISSGVLPPGTVLLSSRAPIGYLAIAERPVAVNQGFIAMVCDGPLPNQYVLRWAEASLDETVSQANGSTFLEISKRDFRPIPVPIPPADRLAEFLSVVTPAHDLMASLLDEVRTLTQTRDALLPKLVSGRIRVPESYYPDDVLGTLAEQAAAS
jgi:type I restriction enzyme S subunit